MSGGMKAEYIEREAAIFSVKAHYPKEADTIASLVCIPAADVRPVVRGKWTIWGRRGIYGVMYECSACHAKYDGITNFCPTCGADMREEQT